MWRAGPLSQGFVAVVGVVVITTSATAAVAATPRPVKTGAKVANEAPNPNFMTDGKCPSSGDESTTCNDDILSAIANARRIESLGPMSFSLSAYTGLSLDEQIFATANLERVERGLAPFPALSSELDSFAQSAAKQGTDPTAPLGDTLPGGAEMVAYGGNEAYGFVNPLGTDYGWMYWDGPGSPNSSCQSAGQPACYAHRDNILGNWTQPPLGSQCPSSDPTQVLMGVGYSTTPINPTITELFVEACGSVDQSGLAATWSSVSKQLFGGTKTTLSLSASGATYGDEQAERASVTVAPLYSATVPAGTVNVKVGSTTLCSVRLSNGKGSCSLPATKLAPGSYQVLAEYAGSASSAASTSSASKLSVAKGSSKSSITLKETTATYGHEQTVRIDVAVAPKYAGTPTSGVVDVRAPARTVCAVRLSDSKGSCTLSATALEVGTNRLVAVYEGDADLAGSTSSPRSLTVHVATTKLSLTLQATTLTYGSEQDEAISVKVNPEFAGSTPTGTVTVNEESTTLCTITLAGGVGSCTLGATQLDAGTYGLVASYSGNGNFSGSTTTSHTLDVDPDDPVTSLKLSEATVTDGDEGDETLSVTVAASPSEPGLTPTGSVTIAAGSTTVCTITLTSGSGSCTLTASQLPAQPDPYELVASYSGDTNFLASTSPEESLTVVSG